MAGAAADTNGAAKRRFLSDRDADVARIRRY